MNLRAWLLILLHHTTLKKSYEQTIDRSTLARIVTFFEQNYKRVENGTERQYAVAINLPMKQCQPEFPHKEGTFLNGEISADVRRVISKRNYPVYQGKELIGAGVEIMKKYKIHSERLLLNLEGRRETPMQYLLKRRKDDSCTVFYTVNSPCADTCLDKKSKYNIRQGLKTWSTHNSIKALVFKQIWKFDKEKKEVLKAKLKKIVKYVPVYRCINEIECYACGGEGANPINEQCLSN
nr:uncharacterized protein LOC129438603 [Misgurnus anguillicaudatus]